MNDPRKLASDTLGFVVEATPSPDGTYHIDATGQSFSLAQVDALTQAFGTRDVAFRHQPEEHVEEFDQVDPSLLWVVVQGIGVDLEWEEELLMGDKVRRRMVDGVVREVS